MKKQREVGGSGTGGDKHKKRKKEESSQYSFTKKEINAITKHKTQKRQRKKERLACQDII